MANRIQYTIGFDTDVSQAKKQIDSLVSQLQKISKISLQTAIDDSSLKSASKAAQELQKHLQTALDVNTGKLNLNAFNNSLRSANTNVSQLGAALLEAGDGGKAAFMSLANSIANAEVPMRRMNATLKQWGTTLKNTAKWEISSTIVHGVEGALSSAVGYVKSLNSSLNDIRIVTGYSADDMTRFAQQANKAAKELSTTTKAYADASLIYFQQGDAAETVAKKAAITTKAANTAFSASAEEMSEMLTAVWNSYQVGEEELEKYVDIMAALGAATATSTEEIATAMQKVAATANTVGVSMQQMASIIATVSSVTREAPESIGTSFKTILARIGDLKLGKTLEDGATLGLVSGQLQQIGIDILDANGNLREMGDVLDSLMSKWDGLTEAQKAAVAQAVAGKRQYTQLMALMENQDLYKKSMGIAANSSGELSKQASIFEESWRGAANRIQASLEKLYSQLVDDKAMVKMLDITEKFVTTISGIIDGFGGLGGVITSVGGLLTQYFSADIASGMIKGVSHIKQVFTDIRSQQTAFIDNQASFRQQVSELIQDNELLTEGDQNQFNAILRISEAKTKLLQSTKTLTDEQKIAVEGVIAAYQKQTAAIAQVQQQTDKLKESTQQQKADLTKGLIADEVRATNKNYARKKNVDRKKLWDKAQYSIVGDALNLDLDKQFSVVDLSGVTKQIQTVDDALKQADLDSEKLKKSLTFDLVIDQAEKLTSSLSATGAALKQLEKIGYLENGQLNLFAFGTATPENVAANLQAVYNEYLSIVDKLGEKPKINLDITPTMSPDELEKIWKQLDWALNNVQERVNPKVMAIKAALLNIVPKELASDFDDLFKKWEALGSAGFNAGDRIKQAWDDSGETMQNEIDKLISRSQAKVESFVKLGGALTSLVSSISQIINITNTLKDPDVSGWAKFGAVVNLVYTAISGAASVMEIVSLAQAAYNTLIKIGTKNYTEYAASIGLANAELVIQNKQMAASALFRSGLGTVAKGVLGVVSKVSLIVAAVAAIAAAGYALYKYSTREQEWAKATKERTEAINKEVEKNKQNSKTLTSNMSQLSAIMNDTSLTYDEQINKINEICAMYGVQAAAVDGLGNAYIQLKNKMQQVSQAEAQKNLDVAQKNVNEASENTNIHTTNLSGLAGGMDSLVVDALSVALPSAAQKLATINWADYGSMSQFAKQYTATSDPFFEALKSPTAYYQYLAALTGIENVSQIKSQEDMISAWKEQGLGKSSAFVNANNSNTAAASLLDKGLWQEYGVAYDGNYQGIRDAGKLTKSRYNTAEGEFYTDDDFQSALERFGFYFDERNASLNALPGKADYGGLYTFLNGLSKFAAFAADADSYSAQIKEALELIDADDLARNIQTAANMQGQLNLYNNRGFAVKSMTSSIASQQEVSDLLDNITEGIDSQYIEGVRQNTLETLQTYSGYKDAANYLSAQYSLANDVVKNYIDSNSDVIISPEDAEALRQKVIDVLPKDIDLNTLIRIHPTDIQIDYKDGQFSANFLGNKEYLQQYGIYSGAKTNQQSLITNKELLTKDTFDATDRATIDSLVKSGALGSNVTTDSFMKLSAATRAALIEQMVNSFDAQADEMIPELISTLNKQQGKLQNKYDRAAAVFESTYGATFQQKLNEQTSIDAQRQKITKALEEYNSSGVSNQSNYDWSSLFDELGLTDKYTEEEKKGSLGKENIESEKGKLDSQWQSIQTIISTLKSYDQALIQIAGDIDNLTNEQANGQQKKWAAEVENATKRATRATEALGKRGELTAEELANLSEVYKNIKDVYNSSDAQWNEFVYENARKAYDELYQHAEGDVNWQAEILQKKLQLQANYWEATAAMRDKAYNDQLAQYEKDLAIHKDASSAMQSGLASGQLTSTQQQILQRGGYGNWQYGNSQAAMQARLSSYGAGLLNESMAQIDINNLKRGIGAGGITKIFSQIAGKSGALDSSEYRDTLQNLTKSFTDAMSEGDATLEAFFQQLKDMGAGLDTATTNALKEISSKHQGEEMSVGEWLALYTDALGEIDKSNSDIWANFEDSATTAISNILKAETDAAAEVFSIWEKTYKAMQDARTGLASGQSIAQSMLGDTEGQAALVQQYLLTHPDASQVAINSFLHSTNPKQLSNFLNVDQLSMSDYGATRGIAGAVITEEDIEKGRARAGAEAGDIVTSLEEYTQLTGARLDETVDLVKQSFDKDTKARESYTQWLEQSGKNLKDFTDNTIAEYVRQREGLDTTQIQNTYSAERAAASVYVSNQQAEDITNRFDQIKTTFDTVYEQQSQISSDWQKIYEASLRPSEGSISELLGDEAAAIATRLGYSKASDLDAISSDYAKAQINSATLLINKASLAFDSSVEGLKSEYGENTVNSVLGQTLSDTTDEVHSNAASVEQQAESINSGRTAIETYTSALGVSESELRSYTQELIDNGKMTEEDSEQQIKMAAALMRQNKGFITVQKSMDDYMKTLSKATKGSNGYEAALKDIRDAYGDVFNLSKEGMQRLSSDLLESAENAELLKRAAQGDNEAFDELQAIVAKDLVENIEVNVDDSELNSLMDEIANYDFGDIQIGTALDDAPFYDQLNSMILYSQEAANAMTEALSSMGVDAQIQEHKVWIPAIHDETVTRGTVPIIGPNGVIGYEGVEATVAQQSQGHWETWYTLQGAKYNGRGVSNGGARHPSSGKGGGGGGGGGGKKAKKLDKKDPEDEKERYHEVNKTLERLSNQYDEIDKKKARIYGKSYIDYIQQEIKLTEKQCDTYQRYIDEAKEYLALDAERVASLGATFDDLGNISNYDEVMDNIIGKYNEFIDKYNAMSASKQEAAEEEKAEWDKWYEEKKKWIENYEGTIATIYEQQNNLLEAQNKISEKMLEGIQYKVEVHIDMTDAEKSFLDYLNDTYDELLEKQGQVMNNLVEETELAVSNLSALGKEKEELDAAFKSGKLNQADYVEGLQDLNDQIIDNLGNIQDLSKQIQELYGNALDKASDAFDKQTDKVKNASDAMASYISILGLLGKGPDFKELTKFYEAQYEYNVQSLEMQKQYLDILRNEEQYYLDRLNSAQGLTETERQQYEALEQTIADVNASILSNTEAALQQIADAFNNEIEIIFKDLEERVAGVGNSMQDLADAYSYYQEQQERYVTSARELYEVNKLNRQIEKTMSETSSKVYKNLLAALQERINKQSELNELTEYDIEMNQLQYELLLRKIALEEAQNAKSTVRLTRDSNGNYVYQYTADQDELSKKQQEYEDVLQKINDLSVERVRDLESRLLEIYQTTLSKIKEVAQDQTLTEQEKYDKIQTLMNQFKEQTNYIQEQYQIASDNLITSNLAISKHYGEQLVEHSENAKNGLNQTIAAMIENTEQLQASFEEACSNKIPAAMDAMQAKIDAVKSAVQLNYDSMSGSVENYNKVTKDAQDQTSKTADTLSKELLPTLHNTTNAWDVYTNKLKTVISTYETMYQAILKIIQAQTTMSNASAPSTVSPSIHGSGSFTAPGVTPGTGSGSSGGGGGGGSGGSGGGGYYGVGNIANMTQYTTITYKTLVTAGESQGKAMGGSPIGPKKMVVGTTGTFNANPSTGYAKGGWKISDSTKVSIQGNVITALAPGFVTVTVCYWDRRGNSHGAASSSNSINKNLLSRFATGGLADFTGPAWVDGSKSKPELVLNSKDTENVLTAVKSVRALDSTTLGILNKYVSNASLAMSVGLGNISAGSVYGGSDTLQQNVHITAEFPNATNSAEIQDAFDNIINRATQYITTKR